MKSSFHKFTAALLAACLFTILACSSDDGGENKPPEQGSQNLFCEISDFYGYDCGEITEAEIGLCREYGGKLVNSCRPPSSSSSSNIIYGPIVRHGGEDYQTVVIGYQTWFARNLNYNVSDSKCYDNSESNCNKYGKLYNWATAMALPSSCNESSCSSRISTKHKGICPSGWHLPSFAEWTTLMDYVGGYSTAGTKLKAASGWSSGNGTNDYGFSALPGGYGNSVGRFLNVNSSGDWWSTSESGDISNYAYRWGMGDYGADVGRDYKSSLHSVRCLKDN